MGADKKPDFLYHYTNLSTLALILKNHTIRFMPLCSLDDPQESVASDTEVAGNLVFVSCWTDDVTERIPMWNMYASFSQGVRIGLPADPFSTHRLDSTTISRLLKKHHPMMPVHFDNSFTYIESLLPEELLEQGLLANPINGGDILTEVDYNDDPDKLCPTVLSSGGGGEIRLGELGRCKNTAWKFQREWRYRFAVLPLPIFSDIDTAVKRMDTLPDELRGNAISIPCNYVDLAIRDDAFSRIEIVLSPAMDDGTRLLAKALLEQHDLLTRLRPSELDGKIRLM